eukprot:TRINITY_DN12250_c0_g1_i1.p1 TRINITY_DN12250_c0_g1~~TRINITY_DN12250_c0_g1_i1.p1  ORF type:complete len:277 (-),score=108.97 TRINITY_DN12250_c0_g1_i1:21-851(-)
MGGRDSGKSRKGEESDGELSDSTRAVLAIQRELEAGDDSPPRKKKGDSRRGDARSKSRERRGGRRGRGDSDEPLGDDRTYGSVTGIKLGEFGSGGGGGSSGPRGGGGGGGGSSRGGGGSSGPRGGKGGGGGLGMSPESLANQADSDDDGNARNMPAAPEGSFKKRDLDARAALEADGRPKAQRGIDGKVYAFVDAGADADSGSEDKQPNGKEGKVAKEKGDKKAKGKDKKKKDKKKDAKKSKKEKKKEKKKAKKKKEKKKKSSSSSDSGSDDSSSS